MAHWAKINDNNIVENVIVTSNEDENEGELWIAENLEGRWIKASYNTYLGEHLLGGTPLRKNFPSPGFSYNSEIDAFIPPKQADQEGFALNEETGSWVPPVAFPEDATWIEGYQPKPDNYEEVFPKRTYYWLYEYSSWGLRQCDCIPKPDGEYFWNPLAGAWEQANSESPSAEHYWHSIDKEWQLPTSEKPDGNFLWLAIEKRWVEIITEQ
jgi:hypothetical protein